jgi:hypothetical protein
VPVAPSTEVFPASQFRQPANDVAGEAVGSNLPTGHCCRGQRIKFQQQVKGNKHNWHTTSTHAARREAARGVADHRARPGRVGAVEASIASAGGEGGCGIGAGRARRAGSTSDTVLPGCAYRARRFHCRTSAADILAGIAWLDGGGSVNSESTAAGYRQPAAVALRQQASSKKTQVGGSSPCN